MFFLNKFLSLSPVFEVSVRLLYWKVSFFNKLFSNLAKYRRSNAPSNHSTVVEKFPINISLLADSLKSFGILEGDILIIHSSAAAINSTGLSPHKFCEELINYLGPNGTLAMPAFPLYREEPKGVDRFDDSICESRLIYNVQKTPPWTGILPRILMKFPDAVRSRHPLNSMIAIGHHAKAMMLSNIDGEYPLPCGVNSSWKYCSDNNAKILFFGVDASHSLTMIHVAEDSWEHEWPVSDWYRVRPFHVIDADFEADIIVRERRPKWSLYYAERTLQKHLLKSNLLCVKKLGNIHIEMIESASLLDYLRGKRPTPYPYLVPFFMRN